MKKSCIERGRIKAAAIDLDGVVYFGAKAVPGAAAAINDMRAAGLKVFFITNNSGKNRLEIADKLSKLGMDCAPHEVITSGYASVLFVKKLRLKKPVLVIGSASLRKEFTMAGVPVTNDSRCSVLVVGMDKAYTYAKIAAGLSALARGAKFIACNVDANFPVENGILLPGCGAMVAAIEAAADRKADVIVGKPNTFMLELIARAGHLKPKEIVVIGDGRDTDIPMAQRFGSPAILITRNKTGGVPAARSLAEAWKIIRAKRN